MKSLLSPLLLLFSFIAIAQDSLLIKFNNVTLPDSSRAKALYTYTYRKVYAQPDSTLQYSEKGIAFCTGKKDMEKRMGDFLNLKGSSFYLKGKFDAAMAAYKQSYHIRKKQNDKAGQSVALMNFANVAVAQGNYPLAFQQFTESEKLRIETKDDKGRADCYNNIANLFQLQNDLGKSIEYLNKAVVLYEKIKNQQGLINAYGNLGALFSRQGNPDKNIEYQQRSIKLCLEANNEFALANAVGNIGEAYLEKGMNDSAFHYLKKCEEINMRIQNLTALSSTHYNLGNLYLRKKQFKEAIKECEHGLEFARQTETPDDVKDNCNCLYRAYKATNNTAKALFYHEEFVKTEKALINEERTKEIALHESRFAYAKKASADSLIALEERKLASVKLDQEKTKQYFLYGGLSLVLMFFSILLNRFRVSQKQKKQIELQKYLVEEKQKEILDSIYYARRIQRALITNENYIHKHLSRNQKK